MRHRRLEEALEECVHVLLTLVVRLIAEQSAPENCANTPNLRPLVLAVTLVDLMQDLGENCQRGLLEPEGAQNRLDGAMAPLVVVQDIDCVERPLAWLGRLGVAHGRGQVDEERWISQAQVSRSTLGRRRAPQRTCLSCVGVSNPSGGCARAPVTSSASCVSSSVYSRRV